MSERKVRGSCWVGGFIGSMVTFFTAAIGHRARTTMGLDPPLSMEVTITHE